MKPSCQTESVVSKPCRNCNGQLFQPENFCRWCGFPLSECLDSAAARSAWHDQDTTLLRNDEDLSKSLSRVAQKMLWERAASHDPRTTALREDEEMSESPSVRPNTPGATHGQTTTVLRNVEEMSQSIAGVVIDTLKLNVALKTGSLRLNRFGVLAIAVLISIPMWLLIVLLSPLNAFIAAKAASTQMSIQ